MPGVLSALPARPLHARPPLRLLSGVRSLLVMLMFAGLLVFSLLVAAPVLVTDWQVRGTAVPIAGAHLSDGRCHSKMFIVDCDVTLSASTRQGAVFTRPVHYIFASFSSGDYSAQVVGDPRRPDWLTTDLALERFWNRTLSLLAECSVLAGLVFLSIAGAVKSWRNRMLWRRTPVVPVPLQLIKVQHRLLDSRWTVRAGNGRTTQWVLPRWVKPFVLDPADQVLGLAVQDGAAVMPLDARLRWVDLTRAERRAALGARPAG